MNNNKKGQAAMEFLMTYGWAILAAIIAIGVLAYFGVFNPGRLAGPAGLVSPPFNLDDFRIVDAAVAGDTDNVTLVITQNLGSSIKLLATPITQGTGAATEGFNFKLPSGVYCSITDMDSTGALIVLDAPTTTLNAVYAGGVGDVGESWTSGTQLTIIAKCPNSATSVPSGSSSWSAGDAARGDVTLRYTKSGSSLTQVSQGNVRGPSQ